MGKMPLYEDLIDLAKRSEEVNAKSRARYLQSSDVEGETILRLAPLGFCNWCGKSLSGRSKYFCAPYKKAVYDGYTHKDYWCSIAFGRWWRIGNPRFKRAVYIRDNFTCQICGLNPTTTNEHGLVIPALGLLAIDHIHPYSKGGKTELGNLQVLCRRCNGKKRNKVKYIPQPELSFADVALKFSPLV